jgi:menaquinone-specific isochorismate synthase
VTTRLVADPGRLVPLLQPESPLLWMRRGYGLAGIGEAMRLEFHGPDRIADAAAAWQQIAAAATVDDPLSVQGTGLVAFASFAFSASSPTSSVLIVPSVLVGRSADGAWLTTISSSGMPPAVPFGRPATVAFTPGAQSADGYLSAVTSAVDRIRSHELSKVVLARDLVGTLPDGADFRRAIDALGMGYPDCWTFSVDGFIGSSPETLVSVQHGTVTARVLAGSAARGADAASDLDAASALATSSKDQDEHRFAVQNVLASLRAHSPNLGSSEMPFTLKLPNLWHLASDIEGTLTDGSTSLDLVGALHPTAAVAGTPTVAALDLIAELEGFDRGRYAGPVGWVGADGDGEWAVAVRSAQVDAAGTVTAWAGAGIVAESDPERELLETRLKFRPIVEAFG